MNTAALLRCSEMTRYFGGLLALDHVNLEVNRGEVLGMLGPNGSGKTTLFNLLTGIYEFSGGQATFDGQDITREKAQSIYKAGVARTFQRSRLCLPLSLFDNIMIGDHNRLNLKIGFNLIRRRAFARQLDDRLVAARALLEVFSPSLGARMLEPAAQFPMLDRRRVEICRALIGQPKLLLLDEPSAGMTHDETHQLMDNILGLREHNPDLAIVVIEHETSVIKRISDRCAVLNFGKKICEGSYDEVVENEEVREAYLGVA